MPNSTAVPDRVSTQYRQNEPRRGGSGDWLTVHELREELRLGERAAYNALRSGQIPSVRVGGQWRIPRSALDDLRREAVDRATRR